MADLTLGVIPMIHLTFKGYSALRNFATEYNSYNKKLRSVLRDITITASIFKDAVNILLAEVIEEDTREIMLKDLASRHWMQHDLDTQLEGILGSSFRTMADSIHRTQGTLGEIQKILSPLSGYISPPKPFEHLAKSVAVIAAAVLKTDPFQFQLRDIQIQSTRKKLLSLAKDHRRDLERLRDELRLQNCEFLDILKLAPYRKSNQRTNEFTIHQVFPPLKEAGNPTCDMTRVFQTVQMASQRLYQVVSQALLCECHMVHLCLDREAKEAPIVKDLKGKSKQPFQLAGSGPHFSFQLTVKSRDGSEKRFSSITQPIRLVFTGCCFKDTDPIPEDNAQKPTICEELLSSNEGYERHLRDSTGSSNSGFLLQRASCSKVMDKASNCMPPLSLDDLIASRTVNLYHLDRLLIAANLAYSLVHFYASPWVGDWSLQTIHYFEKQEPTPNLGLWTPHLSLKCDSRDIYQAGFKNKEIRSLGLILLQLGGKKRFEIPHGAEVDHELGTALDDLCREMGPKYMTFVRNCLYSWSEGSMDLMKDENLNVFLSHVSVLEEQAQFFNPG